MSQKPEGIIHKNEQEVPQFRTRSFAAVNVFFRGANPYFANPNLSDYVLVDGNENFQAQPTYHLKSRTDPVVVTHLWLTAKDFRLLREATYEHGVQSYQLDIDYHEQFGRLLPQTWRCSHFDMKGNLANSTQATVETFSLPETLENSTFALQFASGTLVRNRNNGTWTMVRTDHSERPFILTELHNASPAKSPAVLAQKKQKAAHVVYHLLMLVAIFLVALGMKFRPLLQRLSRRIAQRIPR